MQRELFYCAIDVCKDKLDVEGAALALPEQLGNDQCGYRQLIKAAQLVGNCAELKSKVEQLCQIKGVGQLTALTLLITVPELGTLGRNRMSRLVGLAPLNDDSGTQKNKRFIQGGRRTSAQRFVYGGFKR
jgi:transposase